MQAPEQQLFPPDKLQFSIDIDPVQMNQAEQGLPLAVLSNL
jgi:hypothetical protein